MAKLTTANRYLLGSLFTAMVLTAIAYWVLRPPEWRPHLLNLLARSFTGFAGTDASIWLVAHVYSSVFQIVATAVLVGIVRGIPAARKHWIETSTIVLLVWLGQILLFYGFPYLRSVTRAVYMDHQAFVSANSQRTKELQNLNREVNAWKIRALAAENSRAKSAARVQHDSPNRMTREFRTLASDMMDFQDHRLRNTPTIVFGGVSEVTRKTLEDSNRYNQQAIVDFLKRFGGAIESALRRTRPYGLDPSRLQSHVAELNSIQMMRLIASDVNELADQVDYRNLLSSDGGAGKARCPSYYFNCSATQP